MRDGMQDPIITLRDILTSPPITDANNQNVRVYHYYTEEVMKENRSTWIAIGEPAGETPRSTFLSLRGAGHRYYRSWRYPIYVGGWDVKSTYKVYSEVMKRIREQALNHSDPPKYIEYMYVESVGTFEQEEEDVSPPLIILVIFIVVEFLEF